MLLPLFTALFSRSWATYLTLCEHFLDVLNEDETRLLLLVFQIEDASRVLLGALRSRRLVVLLLTIVVFLVFVVSCEATVVVIFFF